jgi:hypothetical protein
MCDAQDLNPLNLLGGIAEAFGMKKSDEAKNYEQNFVEMQKKLEAEREANRPVAMQGMRQSMTAYDPALRMLEDMYGPGAQFNIEALLQDPKQQVPQQQGPPGPIPARGKK